MKLAVHTDWYVFFLFVFLFVCLLFVCLFVYGFVQVIASVQNQLTPERVNIMLLSKQFTEECHEREKWFGTLYSCEGVCGEGGKGRGRADC